MERNVYNLWRTVKTKYDGGIGWWCTRCGAVEFPSPLRERLRHQCEADAIVRHQDWIMMHGEDGA